MSHVEWPENYAKNDFQSVSSMLVFNIEKWRAGGQLNRVIDNANYSCQSTGNLVGSDMNHIWKSDYDGNKVIWVPNLPYRAGNRALSTGELIVCDDNQGRLVRVELDGSTSCSV